MSLNGNELYTFQDFRLDVGERLLLRNGERIHLPEKAFEILCVLIRQSGHLVSKDELLAEVWPDTVVEENNLDKNISLLRQVLGEVKAKQRFIETVRGRGYRFIGDAIRLPFADHNIGTLAAPSKISSSPGKAVSAPRPTQASGNLAAVVSLAEWRHEPKTTDEVAVHPPVTIQKASLRSRSYWLVSIVAAVCAGLGLVAFVLWSEDKVDGPISSVAVLPFVNVGGDAELEYLADGMSESLIDRLSELPQLKVIARSSSFKYRDENVDLQDAAHELGVQAIVTGRVARRGDDLTIRVELVDVRDNKQLWGEQFTRKAGESLSLDGEIARAISGKLGLKPASEREQQHFAKRGTDNVKAYDLLLKGDFLAEKSATRLKALECYDQAIGLDPNYALAYARLAGTYQSLASSGEFDPRDVLRKIQAAAEKAIELDENLADAHHVLAELARNRRDWTTAEREYQRALELNANLIRALRRYSSYLSDMGRHEEAIAEAVRVKELDPMQLSSQAAVSLALYSARRFEESIAETERTLEMGKIYGLYSLLGKAYSGKKMYAEAISAYKEAIHMGGKGSYHQICLGAAFAGAGEHQKARQILRELETSKEYVSPGELTILYVALGEHDKAFLTLEKAYQTHDLQLQHLKSDPGYDSLHGDTRFEDLVRRVGLPN